MRFQETNADYFDQHRKDHTGRPVLFPAALVGSLAVWAVLIAVATQIF